MIRLCLDCPGNTLETGYGGAWHNFAMCLLRKGVDVMNLGNGRRPDFRIYFGQPSKDWRNFWERDHEKVYGLFTMFESSVLPPYWVDNINSHFDFVIVPSTWCRDIFLENGITKPVFVVPLGIDPHLFPELERSSRDVFTIIWQGLYLTDRKGFGMVEKALRELNLSKVRLIDKTAPFSLKYRSRWEFMDLNFYPEFKTWSICRKMNQAEILMLLREADLSVNPTSGEGFGLIPIEHMATGLPTIVSDSSGCKDYVNPNYNIPIECTEQPSWFGKELGTMERPSFEDLKAKIKYAYENRGEIKEMGKRSAEWVRKEWTYDKATDKLLEVINAFVS